jgi:hypothetical protein
MPQIHQVSVRNIDLNVTWHPDQQATAPDLPLPPTYTVYVHATPNNKPPVGFLENSKHRFVVRGRYFASEQAFVSNNLRWDEAQSERPRVYVFKFP